MRKERVVDKSRVMKGTVTVRAMRRMASRREGPSTSTAI